MLLYNKLDFCLNDSGLEMSSTPIQFGPTSSF